MGYLIEVVVGAIGSFIAAEFWAHGQLAAEWMIQRAVQRLPEDQQERRQEEWLAHLDDTPGVLRKLAHALGCWFSAPAIGQMATVLKPVTARNTGDANSDFRQRMNRLRGWIGNLTHTGLILLALAIATALLLTAWLPW
jgi:hypothetical protein